MTPAARKKLRELAMAATPGPWIAFNELPYRASLHEDVTGDKLGEIRRGRDLDANAAYIAAVHPGAIMELLDALDRSEKAVASAKWDGENQAYKQVFNAARRIANCDENDPSDQRAVMTFAERFKDRAILA